MMDSETLLFISWLREGMRVKQAQIRNDIFNSGLKKEQEKRTHIIQGISIVGEIIDNIEKTVAQETNHIRITD